jgi:LDH2 family malate/lactate/ureidoglycolate dehydrogenase
MAEEMVRVGWQALQDFTQKIFEGVGMPSKDARIEAEVLVWANLRGVDSHGVQRVAEYVQRAELGYMNTQPNIEIVQESAATMLVEADHAFGPVVTVFTMERVIAKARQAGIGWGLIRNTTHQGAMAYYSQMAARAGMAGLAIVTNPPNMAPPGARAAATHNSPIALAVPGEQWPELSLDMATSVAAGGKLEVAKDKGISIPEEWALDKDGQPTTDPNKAAFLRPAGAYKGYGLALMFECLTSLMVANPLLAPTLHGQDTVPQGTQNSVVAAINIANFTDVEGYKKNVDSLVDGVKGLPMVNADDEMLLPGEIENRQHKERIVQGIPLPVGTVQKLKDAAARFGLELPVGL